MQNSQNAGPAAGANQIRDVKPMPAPQFCGETLSLQDEDAPLPAITPAMTELAKKYPELSSEYERSQFCVGEGESCEARKAQTGGEEIATEMESNSLDSKADRVRFHQSVTEEEYKETRDRVALAVKKGFIRRVRVFRLLFRVHLDKKFHESAEGVDLGAYMAAESEAKEHGKLAEILTEMEKELAKNPEDTQSLESIGFYRQRAESNAKNLQLISCEYKKLAGKNREIENSLGALMDTAVSRTSEVTGEVREEMPKNSSGVSGLNEARAPASWKTEALISFELPSRIMLHEPPAKDWQGDDNEPLFVRVHKKYRKKDALGFFERELLD